MMADVVRPKYIICRGDQKEDALRLMNSIFPPDPRDSLNPADRAHFDRLQALNLTAIAFGTGPSFYEFINRPFPPTVRYGCGVASQYIDLDVYCLNSGEHKENVPRDGTPVYAIDRCKNFAPGCWEYPMRVLRAQQAGGMALQLAAMNHKRIGLVGFCKPIAMPIDSEFRAILRYWRERGRVFVSLMKESCFDDLLEKGWPDGEV